MRSSPLKPPSTDSYDLTRRVTFDLDNRDIIEDAPIGELVASGFANRLPMNVRNIRKVSYFAECIK